MSRNLCIFANSKYWHIMDNNDTTLLASSGDYRRLVCYQKAMVVNGNSGGNGGCC